jgi:hypothetical protein
VADTPEVRIRAADIPADRSPAVGIRAGRSPVADTPAAGTRLADSRQPAQPVDTPAGMVVDQAIRVVARAGRQVVWSQVNAPDVVAHEPILSIGGVFLNVRTISVA